MAANTAGQRREEGGRKLRRMLAEYGVRWENRRAGETPERENRRLQEEVLWWRELHEGP